MVKLSDITGFLNETAPPHLAESYDNVGLLVEGEKENIKKVLCSLDTDAEVVNEAKEKGCDMIVSHHPLIFKPIKRVAKDDAVFALIKNNISLYAMHTNYDAACGGLCDVLAEKIADFEIAYPFDDNEGEGIGRIFELKEEISLKDFAENVKNVLGLDSLRVVGDNNMIIKKVALCNGGGGDLTIDALCKGADLYISGDFKYHHARFAFENKKALMEITHYDAEILFIDAVADMLKNQFGNKIEVVKSETNVNPWNII